MKEIPITPHMRYVDGNLLFREELILSWLSTPRPDYVGLSIHLQTIVEQIEEATSQIERYVAVLKMRLQAARDEGCDSSQAQHALDLVTTYSFAARQVAIETALRTEYFKSMIAIVDRQASRSFAASGAMVAATSLNQVLMYRDRASELSKI
ncbi:hypothetical protein [Burkholderia gladioli]|uniref:hypothetical protein n=1 Tax=Burkholderia gladioli TaxID=28095 RepID=UPI00163EA0FE|nr:hypothetical protein [Burkholderia gladioli]MDN7466288.1 hypothetical protein [Burkholderia gladioli]